MSVSIATGSNSGIKLRDILPQAEFLNAPNLTVRSCAGKLQECQQEDLFVALVDADNDGHEDALQAIRKGATAVVTERLLPVSVPQCIVSDSRIAYGKICQALAGQPSRRIKTVAVGGTDGKTTTAHLITSILEEANKSTGLHSSIQAGSKNLANCEDGVTPPALAHMLAEMVMRDREFAVLETNSMQLAEHQFAGVQLAVAASINLRGNHFGFHNSLKNYRRAQFRLLEYLKPSGVAVMNADDPGVYFMLDKIDHPTLTVGIKKEADIRGKIVESNLYETTFTIRAGDETAMVRTSIPGTHHVYNCLIAAATALLQGIDLPTIARGLEKVKSLPGRMNHVRCGQPFPVLIEEAASPYRLGVALHTLRKQVPGKVFCIFNAPIDADPDTASRFGRIAERSCDVPFITRPTTKNSQSLGEQTDYEPIHQILDGFSNPAKAHIMPDRIAAIELALKQAKAGDAILIAGRGNQPIAQLADGRWQLTDMEVCQSWLYGDSVPGESIPTEASPAAIFPIENYRRC